MKNFESISELMAHLGLEVFLRGFLAMQLLGLENKQLMSLTQQEM